MRLHNAAYLGKTGFRYLFSNRHMSFASVGTLATCMFLIGLSVLFYRGISDVSSKIAGYNEITVFAEEDTNSTDWKALEAELNGLEHVVSVAFSSREENLARMCERLGESPEILLTDPEGDNPFLASFTLELDNPAFYSEVAADAESMPLVAAVQGSPGAAKVLSTFQRTGWYAGMGIGLLLSCVSLLILANTIRLTVWNRRREIEVMQVVGATDRFIRMPFLIEGLLIGLLAAGLSLGSLYGFHWWLVRYLPVLWEGGSFLTLFFAPASVNRQLWGALFAAFSLGGGVAASLCCGFSAGRYLQA